MIPIIMALLAMAAPSGYAAGLSYVRRNPTVSDDVAPVLPVLCAVVLPFAMVIGAMVMIQHLSEGDSE